MGDLVFEERTVIGADDAESDAESDDCDIPPVVAGRYQVLERIGEGGMGIEAYYTASTNMRRNGYFAQILCELACMAGELAQARIHLLAADSYMLTDWQWIEHCPVIAPLRGDPRFAAVRARVRVRADAIAGATWG